MTRGDPTNEDDRHQYMEKLLKEWGINKGLWLSEMKMKNKIDKIQDLQ